jgi:hypothetical protein
LKSLENTRITYLMKAAAVSTLVTLVIVFVALVAIEILRKRGSDPVGRVADVVMPLRPATLTQATA